jgi:hypothetical protein
MPRKTRPSSGKGPSQRGRHKKHKSRETRKWLKMMVGRK